MKAYILLLLTLPLCTAHPMINGILYDPVGSDTGKEWIELINPSEDEYLLIDYSLWMGNGAQANDWTLVWNGSDHVMPAQSYYVIGENATQADEIVKLALGNGPDAIALRYQGEVVEIVGYGEHTYDEFYQEVPAQDVISMPLVRVNTTSDNSKDFIGLNRTFYQGFIDAVFEDTNFTFTLDNVPPSIVWNSLPEMKRTLMSSVSATDDTGIASLTYQLKKDNEVIMQGDYAPSISLNPLPAAGTYELHILATDLDSVVTTSVQALIIPSVISYTLTPQNQSVRIVNTGNVPFTLYAQIPALSQVRTLYVQNTSIGAKISPLNLTVKPSEQRVVTYKPNYSGLVRGTYVAQIRFFAKATN